MPRPPNASPQTRLLLAVLSAEPRTWRHGYELAKQTGLSSGTLYPLLMRLHEQGLLAARWSETEQRGRPPRHLYRPTAAGLALARDQAAQQPSAELSAARPTHEGL
jgi:PadR family transcriptional regulator, regulatory protein PadR